MLSVSKLLRLLFLLGLGFFDDAFVSSLEEDFCQKNEKELDVAKITFVSHLVDEDLALSGLSQECWKCLPSKLGIIPAGENFTLNFSSNFGTDLFFTSVKADHSFCNISLKLQDGNEYVVEIFNDSCNVFAVQSNLPDSNTPVYCLIGIVAAVFVIWHVFLTLWNHGCFDPIRRLKIYNRRRESNPEDEQAEEVLNVEETLRPTRPMKKRVRSIDAFRGLSLMVMIFVNYGGGGYWYFEHSAWDGLTVADLVFPWFVFIMGMSITVSFRASLHKRVSRLDIFRGVVRRSILLFCLGLVISNRSCTLSNLRIFGVLQRLALTYFFVGCIESVDAVPVDIYMNKWWSCMRDVLPYWRGWSLVVASIFMHTCFTFILKVPGCPMGYLGPGGLHDGGLYGNCTGGSAGHIDRVILGESHMYKHPTCQKIYKTSLPYDPEGILGTFMSIVICYFGVQTGRIMLTYGKLRSKLLRWIVWAVVMGLIGGGLCGFKKFGGIIPLNKNLWSLSFSLSLSSMAIILFAIFFVTIDHLQLWSGSPLIYPGMNSIVVYICSELFEWYFPLHINVPNSHLYLLLLHVWGVIFWVIISAIMYRKKIFVSL